MLHGKSHFRWIPSKLGSDRPLRPQSKSLWIRVPRYHRMKVLRVSAELLLPFTRKFWESEIVPKECKRGLSGLWRGSMGTSKDRLTEGRLVSVLNPPDHIKTLQIILVQCAEFTSINFKRKISSANGPNTCAGVNQNSERSNLQFHPKLWLEKIIIWLKLEAIYCRIRLLCIREAIIDFSLKISLKKMRQ